MGSLINSFYSGDPHLAQCFALPAGPSSITPSLPCLLMPRRHQCNKWSITETVFDGSSEEEEDARSAARCQQLILRHHLSKAAQQLYSRATVADCRDEAVMAE